MEVGESILFLSSSMEVGESHEVRNSIDLNKDFSCDFDDYPEVELCPISRENEICDDNYITLLEKKVQTSAVSNEHEAYQLYCGYAHVKGFSVRKGKQDYFVGTQKLRSKLFTCSKEGSKDKRVTKQGTEHTKLNERTNCPARIWFTRDRNDMLLKVTKWVKVHNHDLAELRDSHLLKSSRSIGQAQGNLIQSHLNAKIRPIDSYNLAVQDCRGEQNVGYTKKDLYNFTNLLKRSKIEAGDCQSVINHFKKKANVEGLFYWDVQLDVEGRVTNMFWRDSQARIDYEHFGDVVTFDTTFRTNRYGLVCAPFVGVNHHGQNVMFGCGFLSDETITSFKWLFTTFLESMSGKQPKTFFTDQDAAMMNIVPKVFFDSRHRLCTWHIAQNAPSHLPNLYLDKGFRTLFYKCVNDCDSEEEFDSIWSKMISNYNLSGHSWLNNMYKLRHKWSTAFNIDTFYAGLKSTSRSESTNRALNGVADRTTGLHQFVLSYEELVKGWRKRERDEDHRCNQGMPTLSIEDSEILQHAAKIYTCEIYQLFEKEFKRGVGASDLKSEIQLQDGVYAYEVALQGKGKMGTVIFDVNTLEVKCTCCKFETTGILCSHVWKILNMKNMHFIPERYILKRWCKSERFRLKHLIDTQSRKSYANESEMVYSNRLMRFSCNLVMQSKAYTEAREILESAMEEASDKLNKFFESLNLREPSLIEDVDVQGDKSNDNDSPILDPLFVKSKGVSKSRIQSHWERSRKKTQKVVEANAKKKKRIHKQQDDQVYPVLKNITNVIHMDTMNIPFKDTGAIWHTMPSDPFGVQFQRINGAGTSNGCNMFDIA